MAYAEATKSFGLDPYRMFRRAKLPVAALDRDDVGIAADRLQQLIVETAQAAASQDFGLVVGAYSKLSLWGPLGRLVMAQPTVRAAAEALRRFARYQSESVEIYLDPDQDGLIFIPILLSPQTRASPLMNDLCLACCVETFRALLGRSWRPSAAWLTRPAPRDKTRYEQQLGPTEFNAAFNGFALTAAELDVAIPTRDRDMADRIVRQFEAEMAARATTATDTVAAMILHLLPLGRCGVDDVARELGVDRRTVHRRLAAEGASFTELLERVRREVATEQLRHGVLPLGEVTSRVGFSSLSAFSRWFRQAYGMQPSEFRRQSQNA